MKKPTQTRSARQHGATRDLTLLINPFYPVITAQLLAPKATVLLQLTLPIRSKICITAFSALSFFLLQPQPQTLYFLALSTSQGLAA